MSTEEPLPSLPLVLHVLQASRDERRAHLDALDQKAGLALGFAGVLVTLSNGIAQPWRSLGTVAAIAAAVFALWAFWPRPYPVLDRLRKYLAAPLEKTELALVDALDEMDRRTARFADLKARRLKVALTSLVLAVAMLGTGVGLHRSGGNNDRQDPPQSSPLRAAPRTPAPSG